MKPTRSSGYAIANPTYPLIFYFGRRRQAADAASRIRGWRWFGVDQGEPEVYLWGSPMELNKADRIKQVCDRLLNQLVLNAFEMSPERMTEYCRAIQRYQPRCLYGYATSVSLLAAHARDRGIELRLPKLKVVCTTGEPLYPHQRKLIGEVFGVPVANEFGAHDSGLIAHESPAGQMLLRVRPSSLRLWMPTVGLLRRVRPYHACADRNLCPQGGVWSGRVQDHPAER